MKSFTAILFLLFSATAFAQHASTDSCEVYKNKTLATTAHETYKSVQDVIAKPDTTYFLSSDGVEKLNNFLAVHGMYKSSTGVNKPNTLNIKVVISFRDDAGKKHTLGFDYAGDYQLDGLTYYYDSRLAVCENELKLGIMTHQQLIQPKPYKRY